jgi:hypothetical protein
MKSRAKNAAILPAVVLIVGALSIAVCFTVVPDFAFAQDQGSSIAKLVKKLDSNDFSDREDAMNALIRRGHESIPAVAVATETGNPEVRSRGLHVLYAIATKFDKDLAVEEAGLKALEQICLSDNRSLASAAQKELVSARDFRHLEAYTQLKNLGAEFSTRTTKGRTIRFKEEWTGSTEDLWRLKRLNRLEAVEFLGPTVGNDSIVCLDGLPNLLRVYFGSGKVNGTGLQQALKYPSLAEVDTLLLMELSHAIFGDDGAEHLGHLKTVETLGLEHTQVTDACVPHLQSMTALKYLYLTDTQVSDAAVEGLANLKGLKKLYVRETKFTKEGVARLKTLLPTCRVYSDAK